MPNVLIVGATRGLGASLTAQYASKPSTTVYATTRSQEPPTTSSLKASNIKWVASVDIASKQGPSTLASHLKGQKLDIIIITAGFFKAESLGNADWDLEITTYATCTVGPLFVVKELYKENALEKGGKIILVSSEAGSITLRHESEGGGMYSHHASKSALNMVGKLLSLDLKDKGVAVGLVHPGFMRTDLTKSVGFDKFWDDGGAVTPDVAAKSLIEWVDRFDLSKTGEYWAPRGPNDIGTASATLGRDLPTPLQLPW